MIFSPAFFIFSGVVAAFMLLCCICCSIIVGARLYLRHKENRIQIHTVATIPRERGMQELSLTSPVPTIAPVCAEFSFRDPPPSYDASFVPPPLQQPVPTAPQAYELQPVHRHVELSYQSAPLPYNPSISEPLAPSQVSSLLTAPQACELQPVSRDHELNVQDAPPSYDASLSMPLAPPQVPQVTYISHSEHHFYGDEHILLVLLPHFLLFSGLS